MFAQKQTFKNARICLDGSSFQECTFDSCTFTYSGLLPVVLDRNTIDVNCLWELTGPARTTMLFLQRLYRDGAKQLVEDTFDAIRSGKNIP